MEQLRSQMLICLGQIAPYSDLRHTLRHNIYINPEPEYGFHFGFLMKKKKKLSNYFA